MTQMTSTSSVTVTPITAELPTPGGTPQRGVGRAAQRSIGLALLLISAAPIVRYLWVALRRIGYPFELQWMEGGSVEVVHRVLQGHNIYGPPSLHFTPWPYPPLYFWVSAGVARVTGIGFTPLRVVSLGASLVVLGILYLIVAEETGDRVAGLAAAGVYAATFRLAGAWADIGRVDSLFMAFTLAALAVALRARSRRAGAMVGFLFFLSFFTKQDGLLIALPVVVWLVIARRRAGIAALALLGGFVVLSTVLLDAVSHGWYRYYVFDELFSQGIVRSQWRDFWRLDILHPLGLLSALIVVGWALLVFGRRRFSIDWVRSGICAAAATGLIGAAWAGRLHNGGYDNVLMPAYAALAVLSGLALGHLRRHPQMLGRLALSVTVAALLWVQFHRIDYRVSAQIPSARDQHAGEAFLALLRHLPGRVIVLDHPYYAVLGMKGTNADEEAAGDIERSGPSAARSILVADLRTALLRPGVGAVILDDTGDVRNLEAELQAQYHLLPKTAIIGNAFYPVTDLPLRPWRVYVRNVGPASGVLAR